MAEPTGDSRPPNPLTGHPLRPENEPNSPPEAHLTSTPVLDRSQRAELARAARREEILDAARRVFAARGFRGTTIADIADEAGTALGTIYIYFASKEDVFAALHQRFAELIAHATDDGQADASLEEAVARRIGNVFDACGESRDLVRLVVLNADPGTAVAQRIRDADDDRSRPVIGMLEAALAGGLIRDGDPAIMTHLIQGLVSMAVYQAFVVEDGDNAGAYRKGCTDMVLAYLRPEHEP